VILTFTATVRSCEADMADNFKHPSTFDYTCSFGSPITVPVLNNTDTVEVSFYNLITRNCIKIIDA